MTLHTVIDIYIFLAILNRIYIFLAFSLNKYILLSIWTWLTNEWDWIACDTWNGAVLCKGKYENI
jgi:hypothetical protein